MKNSDYIYSDRWILLIALLVSTMISIYMIYGDNLLGRDSFLYLETADIYLKEGFQAAKENYNWPFFSIIVARLSDFLRISLASSIQILSVFFHIILTYIFFRIVKTITQNNSEVIVFLVIFLLSATINEYRTETTRDSGFWAFTFAGIYFFLETIKDNKYSRMLFCILCLMMSVLFRTEGILNLISIPVIYLLIGDKLSKKQKLIFILSLVILTIGATGYLLSTSSNKLVQDLALYLNPSIYLSKIEADSQQISKLLPSYSQDYSMIFLISGISSILLSKLFIGVGKAYSILAILNAKNITSFYSKNRIFAILTLLLAAPLVSFCYSQYFLSTRYTVNFSIILCFPIGYAVIQVVRSDSTLRKTGIYLLIFVSAIDGLISFNNTDKTYFSSAVNWVQSNLQQEATISTNDRRLYYLIYGKYKNAPIYKTSDNPVSNFLLFTQDLDDIETTNALQKTGWKKITSFSNDKLDSIVIYKNTSPSNS